MESPLRPDDPAARLESRSFADVVRTQRAVRRLRPDPVPASLVLECVELAVHAPSGANRQDWAFVAVNDPARKAAIAAVNKRAADEYVTRPAVTARMRDDVAHAAAHMAEAPWIMIPCYRIGEVGGHHQAASRYGSVFPAVQNFLLACHAVGLGACLTTMALRDHDEIATIIGLTDGMLPCAVIPVGWPAVEPGPPRRKSAAAVAFRDDVSHPLLP